MEFQLFLRLAFLAVLCVFLQPPRPAQADQLMFHAQQGVAIGGYDTVAFFNDGHATQGHAEFAVMWKGAIWQFVSKDHQSSFEANPRAYAPRFGGYCAYAVSQGYLMSGNPESWQIVEGELFLLYSRNVHQIWQRQSAELITQARSNWPGVLRQ